MTVVDVAGAQIGELLDVVALCASETAVVTGFLVEHDAHQYRVSWAHVAEVDVDAEKLHLSCLAACPCAGRTYCSRRATATSSWAASTRAPALWRGASVSVSSRAACRGAAATSCRGRTSISSRCGCPNSTSSKRSRSWRSCIRPTSPT